MKYINNSKILNAYKKLNTPINFEMSTMQTSYDHSNFNFINEKIYFWLIIEWQKNHLFAGDSILDIMKHDTISWMIYWNMIIYLSIIALQDRQMKTRMLVHVLKTFLWKGAFLISYKIKNNSTGHHTIFFQSMLGTQLHI